MRQLILSFKLSQPCLVEFQALFILFHPDLVSQLYIHLLLAFEEASKLVLRHQHGGPRAQVRAHSNSNLSKVM